jgi:murein DD-endopeptidase MepM/ murein hydrolase activator NlpD
VASGFGYRIDPVYKIKKFHEGIDFTAPTGTPIYATGDGVVEDVSYQARGYGNHIIINQGFGYKTLYGHCSSVVVKKGQKVKRGQLIAKVGNTGKSTGPHCHYEVWKNNEKVDPINFFSNDLTPAEYEHMLEISRHHNQSFD